MKKVFRTLLGILTALSLVFSIFFMYSMYEQYEESVKWDSSSLLTDIHNVPPELAKNYVSGNEEELAQALTEVNNALDNIEENEEVVPNNIDDYKELLIKVEGLLEKADLIDSDLVKPLRSLQLYVNTEEAITEAYEVVSTEKLSEYSTTLVNRLNTRDSELDKIFLNRLASVAKDYSNLEIFSKRALEILGVIENDILHVNSQINKSDTEEILSGLSDSQLLKFRNIKRLEDLLRGGPWENILAHNKSTNEFHSWEESRLILESLHYSNYKPVSDFIELQDALDYQPSLRLEERYGYEIDIDSSYIENVYYQGRLLSDDMYVKNGINLEFDIVYSYNEIEIEVEEIIDEVIDEPAEQEDIDIEEVIKDTIQNNKPSSNPDKKPDEDPNNRPTDNESNNKGPDKPNNDTNKKPDNSENGNGD